MTNCHRQLRAIHGSSASSNHELFCIQIALRQLGCGNGKNRGPYWPTALTVSVIQGLPSCIQVISMCVLTSQERQLQARKMLEQAFVPARRALRTGRIVASVLSPPGNRILLEASQPSLHRRRSGDPAQSNHARRSPLASFQGIPLRWTLLPVAWPTIKRRAALANCTTGRGPSGSAASTIRQARTSRNMRFSDIQRLSAQINIAGIRTARVAQSIISSGLIFCHFASARKLSG